MNVLMDTILVILDRNVVSIDLTDSNVSVLTAMYQKAKFVDLFVLRYFTFDWHKLFE